MEEKKANHGKRDNQKLKPYLVQQYLLRNTDANHVLTSYDIIEFLESCGIAAERRSIYRDIEDINKVMWLMDVKSFDEEDDGITIEDAIAALDADEDDSENALRFTPIQECAKLANIGRNCIVRQSCFSHRYHHLIQFLLFQLIERHRDVKVQGDIM